ncbi:unnamed protein product, partial [Didymodactylos carnosus]
NNASRSPPMKIIIEKSSQSSTAINKSTLNSNTKLLTQTYFQSSDKTTSSTTTSKIPVKLKSISFDEHHRSSTISSTSSVSSRNKSVLEHLVFVFPDNVKRMLAGGNRNLTVRNDEGRPPLEPIDLGEPPSIEEIKSWADSFEKLMQSQGGRHHFREFLRSEYSEENMLFWLSCEELKTEQNPEIIEEKARLIYEDYISILSPKEVSLDSRVREVINKNMVDPTPHTFEEAQVQIFTLMHRDSYPRFINSQTYKRLLRGDTKV